MYVAKLLDGEGDESISRALIGSSETLVYSHPVSYSTGLRIPACLLEKKHLFLELFSDSFTCIIETSILDVYLSAIYEVCF